MNGNQFNLYIIHRARSIRNTTREQHTDGLAIFCLLCATHLVNFVAFPLLDRVPAVNISLRILLSISVIASLPWNIQQEKCYAGLFWVEPPCRATITFPLSFSPIWQPIEWKYLLIILTKSKLFYDLFTEHKNQCKLIHEVEIPYKNCQNQHWLEAWSSDVIPDTRVRKRSCPRLRQ